MSEVSKSVKENFSNSLLDTAEDISPLEPFKPYDLPTPYDSFGAGAILMASLSVPQT